AAHRAGSAWSGSARDPRKYGIAYRSCRPAAAARAAASRESIPDRTLAPRTSESLSALRPDQGRDVFHDLGRRRIDAFQERFDVGARHRMDLELLLRGAGQEIGI